MKFIRLAVFMGFLTSIPLCMLIYFGVVNLERRAGQVRELREALSESGYAAVKPEYQLTRYPISRVLSNDRGRSLRVLITGRTENEILFFSLSNFRDCRYPISRLSRQDRRYAETLTIKGEEDRSYPIPRLLTSVDGRNLPVVIEGRSNQEVSFRSLLDQRDYDYAIRNLSSNDRMFLLNLPRNR